MLHASTAPSSRRDDMLHEGRRRQENTREHLVFQKGLKNEEEEMYDTAAKASEEEDPVSVAAGDEEGSSSGMIGWVFQPFRMVSRGRGRDV